MASGRRSEPMPVKHWSFAGLMLTNWCNGQCASCYLCCGPAGREQMPLDVALSLWRGLIEASPHGCRIHLTGGEPFGDWPHLIALCERARQAGLGPLEKVETNAFWATGEPLVRDRVRALDAAGMGKLCISADPYHQQYVPIDRCRLAARVAEEVLGAGRVQVRWRDWLAGGFDTDGLDEARRARLFARYAAGGRDRLNGRAAEMVAPYLQRKPVAQFADSSCGEVLLRSKHVHVDPGGRIFPGVCAGVVIGLGRAESIERLWRRFHDDHARRPVVGTLVRRGPVGLIPEAERFGFLPQPGYADKCHLCWSVRRHLVQAGRFSDELGPVGLYGAEDDAVLPEPGGRPNGSNRVEE